jgi:hypothetical protein
MGNKEDWGDKCRELFKKRKNKEMSPIDKILDEFCREQWHCTLYQGGSAAGNPNFYELYRGFEIDDKHFVRLISQEEILEDKDFQEWYYPQKNNNTYKKPSN